MNKTSWIFYFMCNPQIINRIINIKYHSYDEVIENIYKGFYLTSIPTKT